MPADCVAEVLYDSVIFFPHVAKREAMLISGWFMGENELFVAQWPDIMRIMCVCAVQEIHVRTL